LPPGRQPRRASSTRNPFADASRSHG
jgi:hypothetical protein